MERERRKNQSPNSLFICSLGPRIALLPFALSPSARDIAAAVVRTMMSSVIVCTRRMRLVHAREQRTEGARGREEEEEGSSSQPTPYGSSSLFFARQIRTDAGGREVREGRVEVGVCVKKVFLLA